MMTKKYKTSISSADTTYNPSRSSGKCKAEIFWERFVRHGSSRVCSHRIPSCIRATSCFYSGMSLIWKNSWKNKESHIPARCDGRQPQKHKRFCHNHLKRTHLRFHLSKEILQSFTNQSGSDI